MAKKETLADEISRHKKAKEAIDNIYVNPYDKLSIDDMLNMIENKPRREKLLKLHKDFQDEFNLAPCSIKYHGANRGGLAKHTKLVMQYMLVLWDMFYPHAVHHYQDMVLQKQLRKDGKTEYWEKTYVDKELRIKKDSFIMIAFLHDFGKISSYEVGNDDNFKKVADIQTHDIHRTLHYAGLAGIKLTNIEQNAILFHSGGWTKTDYYLQPQKLAYFIHIADLMASQILEI